MIIAVAINPRAWFGRKQHTGEAVVAFFRAAGARVLVLRKGSYDRLAAAVDEAVAVLVAVGVAVGMAGVAVAVATSAEAVGMAVAVAAGTVAVGIACANGDVV